MRKLERKDRSDMKTVELQAKVAAIFRAAGYEPRFPTKGTAFTIDAAGHHRILVYCFPIINDALVGLAIDAKTGMINQVEDLWIIGEEMRDGLNESRDQYGSRILLLDELERDVERLKRNRPPDRARSQPSARTRVGKALALNGDELKTAATTSLLLIEDRLEVLNSERPNSEEAKAQRHKEIESLTILKDQLAVIRDLPEQVKKGTVSEGQANRSVKSLTDAVREYWNKNSETICSRAVTIALFSSTVLVCKLAGASGDFTIAVSAAMAGGKNVMDGLKGIARKVFKGAS